MSKNTDADLITAWEEFCDGLKPLVRTVLERGPHHDVDRAEGIRHLTRLLRLGFLLHIEHGDPAAPRLIRYMDDTMKFGVDNPDQVYLWARISEKYEYRLWGTRGTTAYVGIGVYAGSIARGDARTVAHVDLDEMALDADGRFEVCLGVRPRGRNWIRLEPGTSTLIIRQTMNDRTGERPGELHLERIDAQEPPPPVDSRRVARGLLRTVRHAAASLQVFCGLADRWAARPNVFHLSDTRMARSTFGDPDLYYAGGYWKVAADEALVIDFVPPACRYWSFLLCNHWAESLDYRYRPVWTNASRARLRDDGSVRIVVAHRDPRIADANWIDTEGHFQGVMTLRYLGASETPLPSTRLVPAASLPHL